MNPIRRWSERHLMLCVLRASALVSAEVRPGLANVAETVRALANCDEALMYAPNWKELKDVREALIKHAGQFGFPIAAGRIGHLGVD